MCLQVKLVKYLNIIKVRWVDLQEFLKIKLNARVMLTININLKDRLINGQLGTVKHILINSIDNIQYESGLT